ncbi:MAG: DNA gyrase subunit A [Egibacteraceae bacterium]
MSDQTLPGDRIQPIEIEEELQRSYLDYAMSVIVGRALPDVRDGLKPVHRRILYSMFEGGMRAGTQHRKAAAAVGDVMKKYHPHGDTAIYDALVRMAQPWAIRYPLIEGHGNFGSVDGDPPAAMRYCLTGDALVRTAEHGTVRIGDIVPDAVPQSDHLIELKVCNRLGDPVRATTLFHSGSHPTLRLRTTEGYELVGTVNHPVLCLVSVLGVPMLLWKLLSEITPGDHVVLTRSTEAVAGELAAQDRHLAVLVGQRSAEKRIPSFVWSESAAFKRLFLQALFTGDGSSSLLPPKTILITYSTRSERLASEVQQLLLEFGVVSRQCHYAKGEIKLVVSNRRDARVFSTNVGFLGAKQAKLEHDLAAIPVTSRAGSGDTVPFIADYIRSESVGSAEVRAIVEPLVEAGYYYAKVKSVTDAGVQPVYSLKVESDDHAFITNGFVSHNTEARLSPLAMELLRDIEEDTVDFVDNYDGQEREPVVLPSRFPNLLVNGSSGIAVGMATNVAPHNLIEMCNAVIATIENPDITLVELGKIVPGPDFPTGALIMGIDGIREAYATGRGAIRMRAVVEVEESGGRERLVVTELPYQVNKANLAVKIADLVKDRRITGIADLRDESNRRGMRLVIELKRDAQTQVVLNQLYKMTQLQDTFGIINLALVDGVPRTMPLKATIGAYIGHQVEMITRRTQYRLRKAQERAHVLEGLIVALDHLDEVIALIRGAESADAALTGLQQRFDLSEIQARAILDMQLRRLAALERQRILHEHRDLLVLIVDLRGILDDPSRVRAIIVEELTELRDKFGDPRRTRILPGEGDFNLADLIAEEEVVVTLTRAGYVKRVKASEYRTQRRGGKGVAGTALKEDDIVRDLFVTTTHHWLLFFTNRGRVYRVKAWEIPEKGRTARGTYVANVPGLALERGETIAAVLDLRDFGAEEDGRYLVFSTRRGMVKRTALREYDSPRSVLIAISLRDGDELIGVQVTSGDDEVMLVSRQAMAIRFSEGDVRPMSRDTSGVKGMGLDPGDEVLSMCRTVPDGQLLVVTEEGYGKRTPLERYPPQRRGGKGVRTAQLTAHRGGLVGALVAAYEQEIFIVTDAGTIIRMDVKDIRPTGRATQGVRVMKPSEGAKVASIAPVVESDELDE